MALENLTPVTRPESILSGESITPVTRHEYFLQQAANEVPKPSGVSDAGKVLTVNAAGTGFELDTPASGLPAYESTDEGKVLGLADVSGTVTPAWVQSGGVPAFTGADYGKALTVGEDADHNLAAVWSETGPYYVVARTANSDFSSPTLQTTFAAFMAGFTPERTNVFTIVNTQTGVTYFFYCTAYIADTLTWYFTGVEYLSGDAYAVEFSLTANTGAETLTLTRTNYNKLKFDGGVQ